MKDIRITARTVVAMRATEMVLRKYVDDDAAHWVFYNIDYNPAYSLDGLQVEETHIDGLVWSPKSHDFHHVTMVITGRPWAGRYVLCGAGVYNKKDLKQRSASYMFAYVGVKDLENFKVNSMEFPNGTLPGFFSPLPGD